MRKVTVEVTVSLAIRADDGVEIGHIIDEMEYDFTDTTTKADIEDMTIEDWKVTDSK